MSAGARIPEVRRARAQHSASELAPPSLVSRRRSESRAAPPPLTAALAVELQRTAGNAATRRLIRGAAHRTDVAVSRCGGDRPDCGCNQGRETTDPAPVQRDPLTDLYLGPGTDPFGLGPKVEQLKFTNRTFMDESQPTVCPRCHDQRPTIPQFRRYVDREATEPRLVEWGQESKRVLHHSGSVRALQLHPGGADTVVEDYGVGLIKRITSTHEFEGSEAVRAHGAEVVRRRWSDIRSSVRRKLTSWYREELTTAVGMTPKYASPVIRPEHLRAVLSTRHGGRAPLGRWGAVAVPGQKYGLFVIHDIGLGQVWFHLPDRPRWLYEISQRDFKRHDPFVAAVAEQAYDQTKWVLEVTPLLLKAGAFAMGFSGSIAVVIAGIALDELAEELEADVEGRPGRTPAEILGSAGVQLLVDRIFHGLLGGGAGRVAASTGRAGSKIERIAERAIPTIRKELSEAEKPLVKQALEEGTARRVTDPALKAQGYAVELAVESGGQRHLYRLNSKGRWCRFSKTICDLDLGADVLTAAKSSSSFTKAKLEDTRALMATVGAEIEFLGKVYERMRRAGRVDMTLLSAAERTMLDELVPTGDASRVSLRELRDLPRSLRLKRDLSVALEKEGKLVQQLYREGRPLHEIMRAASPSYAARSRVLAAAHGRDAATMALPRSGELHVDHIVPLNDIVRMDGFAELRPERQLEVVNDASNLCALDSVANVSRGDRSWWTWTQATIHYDTAAITRMRALEGVLRIYLQGRIHALLRS